MKEYQIVIDAGHGGTDSGATSGNVLEKDLTLKIAQYMYEQFVNKGIPATLIRSTDETISPTERVRRILEAYGDNPNVVVISNHINAAGSETSGAEGAEVIYALRNNDTLAKNILQAIGNEGQIIRYYYQRRLPSDPSKDYYFIHRDTGKTEPVIVEYGFIDNPTDLARIQNNYKRYVDAVVNAVIATKSGQTVPPTTGSGSTYIVKSGDSLYSIATRYNTTVDALKKLNNLTSNNLSVGQILQIPTIAEPGGTSNNTYVVKSGDSLYSIATRYNTTVDTLKSLNGLSSNSLSIGQVLKLPTSGSTGNTGSTGSTGTTYIVKSGDSLYNIATRYNTTVSALRNANNLVSDNLYIGQVLKIPTSGSTGSTGSTGNTGTTYVVKSGDSLWSIANRYNTTVDTIKSLNGLTNNSLSIGQVLKLPTSGSTGNTGSTYVVKSGDSLYNIATRYNTTVNALRNANNLINDNLYIGQILNIPTY